MSFSAFWTLQHGCPPNLAHTLLQRCNLIAMVASRSVRLRTILRKAHSVAEAEAGSQAAIAWAKDLPGMTGPPSSGRMGEEIGSPKA
jgi:hypothetical protein